MNAADLSAQLTSLSESLRTANTLIGRLAKLTFQPGSEPLDGKSGVRVELAQDIHDSLKLLEEELELLKQEVEDLSSDGIHKRRQTSRDSEEARLTAKATRLGEELVHSRQQFRNAQISAKRASEEAKRKEREALIEGYRKEAELIASAEAANGSASTPTSDQVSSRNRRSQQQKVLSKDEVLANASGDVTAALRRTHDLLSTELSRSRFAQETFDESTAALEQLGEEYSNLDSILSSSRNLLGTLLRSQKSDTWYLETAFYILITTLCWLVFRRILFGPFIKLPLFLWRVVSWVVFKPLFLFLSVTGVITKEPISSLTVNTPISSSRPPLIIQPSAQGRAPTFQGSRVVEQGIPVGAGGAHAKESQTSILAGQLSESIAKMAEESAKPELQQEQQEQEQDQVRPNTDGHEAEQKEPVRRGDGTILQERGEAEAPNPKKKVFDADVEDAKQRQRRKRDEL